MINMCSDWLFIIHIAPYHTFTFIATLLYHRNSSAILTWRKGFLMRRILTCLTRMVMEYWRWRSWKTFLDVDLCNWEFWFIKASKKYWNMLSIPLQATPVTAELIAIKIALISLKPLKDQTAYIYSDSLSSIKGIQH